MNLWTAPSSIYYTSSVLPQWLKPEGLHDQISIKFIQLHCNNCLLLRPKTDWDYIFPLFLGNSEGCPMILIETMHGSFQKSLYEMTVTNHWQLLNCQDVTWGLVPLELRCAYNRDRIESGCTDDFHSIIIWSNYYWKFVFCSANFKISNMIKILLQ